jgi:protocatechuate 3,4-dioxygenase beta subunit
MIKSIKILSLIVLLSFFINSQDKGNSNYRLVGGPCEGCEAVFEYGNKNLSPVDTLPGFDNEGIKIKLTGTVYQNDGETPAEGVILYIYHTDQNGIYATRGDETGWAMQHGYIRGWIKTTRDGRYTFYTLKPGAYPSPNGKYYWLGSFHFEGDPLLTEIEISPELPRGGSSGLLALREEGILWVGKRDIILGMNVPDYD